MRKRSKFKIAGSNAFAFVVDGDTEVWYLQMLKRNERELNINIEPKLQLLLIFSLERTCIRVVNFIRL